MGFSLNNLTLFGLVLAIGIVVDDAIVVVEAVEHHIERGLAPREATLEAMRQVSGPVIAVGLVLSAVFVPCAFISGITGQFFRQFALTIAVSTAHLGVQFADAQSRSDGPFVAAARDDKETRRQEQGLDPLPRLAFPLAGGLVGLAIPNALGGGGSCEVCGSSCSLSPCLLISLSWPVALRRLVREPAAELAAERGLPVRSTEVSTWPREVMCAWWAACSA